MKTETGAGRELSPEERWERATIANSFIFYKVMRSNPDVCAELLEILLGLKVERLEMRAEEEVGIDFQSKRIRMDVYARDSDGSRAYNIEMQAADTGELPERARYYQGVMDVDSLKSGQKYRELRTTYIVFICAEDIFKSGLARYTFESLCAEDPAIKIGDRTQKVFFICKNCDRLLDKRQRAFLQMVADNTSTDGFTARVRSLVQDAKHNTQWRKQYMDWEREKTYAHDAGIEEGISIGRTEGIAIGVQQKAEEAARALLREGISPELVAKCVALSLEQVLELKD